VTQQFRCIPLLDRHYTDYFSCGHDDDLDRWLDRQALADQNLGRSATHVWTDGSDCVVAYFTLLQTTIREGPDSIFSRIRPPGFPRNHELPGILIGKLALDRSLQRRGLGLDLLADAYFAACEAVTLIGGAVLVVDPMNEKVASLYREFGFNSIEGSDRMVLNFREFNKGTPLE
jgi:ribosomal protein S18 acetylase RimI-like enzyme